MCASWQNVVFRIRKQHSRYSNTSSKIHPSTLPSVKGFDAPTLLTQVSESTSVKGETPLAFPEMYLMEGDFLQRAAALCKGKVARLPSTPGNGRQTCCGRPLSAHISSRWEPSLKRPKDILLALSIFVPFKAIYATITSHQSGKK